MNSSKNFETDAIATLNRRFEQSIKALKAIRESIINNDLMPEIVKLAYENGINIGSIPFIIEQHVIDSGITTDLGRDFMIDEYIPDMIENYKSKKNISK